MSVASWVTTMVGYITSAFSTFLTNVGSGIVDFFESIFLYNAGTTEAPNMQLTTFASVSLVMLGISLAIGVTTLVVHWVRRK